MIQEYSSIVKKNLDSYDMDDTTELRKLLTYKNPDTGQDTYTKTATHFTEGKIDQLLGLGFDFYSVDFSVEADDSKQFNEEDLVYIGVNELSHNSTETQNLTSSSFSKAVSNTITTQTTKTLEVGVKACAKFKVPMVGETGVEISGSFSFAKMDSEAKTETLTYNVPAQTVSVKQNEVARVTVSLIMMESRGNVKLIVTYKGKIIMDYKFQGKYYQKEISFYDWVENVLTHESNKWLIGELACNSKSKDSVNVFGKGDYKAQYGTRTIVDVKFYTKNNSTSTQGEDTPDRSYSYEVVPYIVKD